MRQMLANMRARAQHPPLLNHHDTLLLYCFGKTMQRQTDRANLIRYVLLGVRFTSFPLLSRGVCLRREIIEQYRAPQNEGVF